MLHVATLFAFLAVVVQIHGLEDSCPLDSNGNPEKGCNANSDSTSLLQGQVRAQMIEDDDSVEVEDDLEEIEDDGEDDDDDDDDDDELSPAEQARLVEDSIMVQEEEEIADADTDDEFIYDPLESGEKLMRSDDLELLNQQLNSVEYVRETHEYTHNHFDCADELILRLAMSESMLAPMTDLAKCEAAGREAAANGGSGGGSGKNGGSGKPGSGGSGKGGSGGSGEKERTGPYEDIRFVESQLSKCQQARGHQVSLGPRLVRMVGHDAADYKNTQWANGSTVTSDDGGVDACLHSALISQGLNTVDDKEVQGEKGNTDIEAKEEEALIKGDANHNRGLGNAVAWIISFADASKLSRPDVEVLGATVYLEGWADAKELGVRFGRKRGQCLVPVCLSEACWTASAQFFKKAANVPIGSGAFCPYTNSITPGRNVLGLSVEEFVALQGAHSVGGVMMCSGMGDVSSGPFCPSQTCNYPPVLGSRPGYDIRGLGFGGTSFDQTPGKLDNEYYKQLDNEDYAILPNCGQLEKPFPHIQRGGSGGGGPVIVRGETEACKSRGTKTIACKDRYRFDANKTTGKDNWPGVFGKQDSWNTCATGLTYRNQDQCDVGTCADDCMKSPVCQESLDVENSDAGALKKAYIGCNACKLKCKFPHGTATTNTACFKLCKKAKKTELKDVCRKKKNAPRKTCATAAYAAFKACDAACQSKVDGRSGNGAQRPVNWCKTLPPYKVCDDPKYTTGNRRGANNCGTCPTEKCHSGVNLGGGRGAGIKSVNRWSLYRGVVKRVMVLPSDWSYLKDDTLKKHWSEYAKDNDKFLTNFAIAWKKTTEKGKENVLKSCAKVTCTLTAGTGISCPVSPTGYSGHAKVKHGVRAGEGQNSGLGQHAKYTRPTNLVFNTANCAGDTGAGNLPQSGSCELVGGFGVRAKFQCGGWSGTCCDEHRGCQALKNIEEEWATGGGKSGTCTLPPMPAVPPPAVPPS